MEKRRVKGAGNYEKVDRELRRLGKAKTKRIQRVLQADIHVIPDAPNDRESFLSAFAQNQAERGKSGVLAFARHELTNYERILRQLQLLKAHPEDVKRVRDRANKEARRYLNLIGAIDLLKAEST